MSKQKKRLVSLEDALKAISNLEELENAGDEHEISTDEPEEETVQTHTHLENPTMEGMATLEDAKPAGQPTENIVVPPNGKSLKERVESKGLDVTLSSDNKTVVAKSVMSFSNVGKKTIADYKPTLEDLNVINKDHSNIDLTQDQILTFTLRSADIAVDRKL